MTRLRALRAFSLLVFGAVLVIVSPRTNAQDAPSLNPIEPIRQIEVETAAAVAWNPDGTILAVGDKTGVLFYTPELEFIRRLEQPSEQMMALAWSPDGSNIAAVGTGEGIQNDGIYVWNTETGKLVTAFTKHTSLVPALAWSPDGTQIASGDWHSALYVWNPLTGDILQTLLPLPDYSGSVMSLSWSPMNNRLAVVVLQYGVVIWDLDSGDIVTTIPRKPYPPNPYVVSWSPDGETLASEDGLLLNGENGMELHRFEYCPLSASIDWHPDGELLAAYKRDGVFVCDVLSDNVVAVLSGGITETETVWGYLYSLDWDPNGVLLAGAAGDGFVRIWSVSEAVDAERSSEREN